MSLANNQLCPIIRFAGIKDIPDILSILKENLIPQDKSLNNLLEQNGFLLNDFDDKYAQQAILDKNNYITLVCTENNEVKGYTLGHDAKQLPSDLKIKIAAASSEINDILTFQKTFYHKHIAKKANTKNIGNKLLHALFDNAKNLGYKNIICLIAHNPIQNKASIQCHEKAGFSMLGLAHNNNKSFGVYLKKI